MQAVFAERLVRRDAAAAECLCTLFKSVRCTVYDKAATRATTSLLCFAQRPLRRLPAPAVKAWTDAALLEAREPCRNAAAQCACVADWRVNVCATIARRDLIAHLDGASGCG
jgi:hypothetical protein